MSQGQTLALSALGESARGRGLASVSSASPRMRAVERSLVTIDLGAIRRNAETLRRAAGGAELWAVVKADGYGHGAVDVARAALAGGAKALCVATIAEALPLRAAFPRERLVVMGPVDDLVDAREAGLELVAADGRVPEGVPTHLKLDTGMGRWGLSELPAPTRDVVGVMTHLASAESDREFTRVQIDRFRDATAGLSGLTRHLANSAGTLGYPDARFDAVRCGIALYGISPSGGDVTALGLAPALRWESQLALVKRLAPGESTGYGRRFVAERQTWIGIVPIGYADGFRRDMTGTHVVVEGRPAPVVGAVSMDAIAIELGRELPRGTVVTLVGERVTIEEHARVAGTIGYEIATGIATDGARARRVVRDG
jgi:alanine racemase